MCLLLGSTSIAAFAGNESKPAVAATSAGARSAMVEWVVPVAAPAPPQTEEEKEAGRKSGRTLPTAELLRPSLDAGLPAYRPRKDLKLAGQFKGASSDVLVGLVNLWAERFKAHYPKVDISVAPPYAGSLGTKELIKESVDFVFVSRELKPEDISEFEARFGYGPTSIPVSGGSYRHFGFLDALGFFVHKDNPIEALNYDQIDAIFSSTRHRGGQAITTWGQLGLTGEWANQPIHVHAIKPWNGFEEFIRQRVLDHGGKRGEWREDLHFEKLVFPMARNVATDRLGLGYSGLAYIDAPVKMIAVGAAKEGPYVSPTYENVALARYPLSRLVFFNINKVPAKPLDPVIEEFMRFILSREGQQAVLDQAIFLPLREAQAESSRALFAH
jgi:phosphate transport system substrate-binding protein